MMLNLKPLISGFRNLEQITALFSPFFRRRSGGAPILPAAWIILFFSLSANAKLLIITHPDRFHDVSFAGAECSRALLESDEYSPKLVLMAPVSCTYTFSEDGLTFSHLPSRGGEHEIKASGEVVLAGGYFDGCMVETVISLVAHARGDLAIHFKMAAIYFHNWSLFPETGRDIDRLHADKTYNLIDFERAYGEEEFKRVVRAYGKQIREELRPRFPVRVRLSIDGQNISPPGRPRNTFRPSERRIRFDFVH